MRSTTFENYSENALEDSEASMDRIVQYEQAGENEFSLRSELSDSEEKEILLLLSRKAEASFLQLPAWDRLVKINGDKLYFTYHAGGKLKAYAIVRFPNRRKAKVDFEQGQWHTMQIEMVGDRVVANLDTALLPTRSKRGDSRLRYRRRRRRRCPVRGRGGRRR